MSTRNTECTRAPSPLVGAILAGGFSRRMGQNKAAMRLVDGCPMIEWVARALERVTPTIVVIGSSSEERCFRPHVQMLSDLRPGLGPLAGIEALLVSNLADAYLVAGCDQPLLSPFLLEVLAHAAGHAYYAEVCVIHCGNSWQPLPSVWRPDALRYVRKALDAGEYRLQRVIADLRPHEIAISPEMFATAISMNCPDDLIAAGLLEC